MIIKKVPISEVELWEDNPRNIKTKDFERLKKQILKLGVYKPLIACPQNGKYIVLGGNMRLRALQELKINEVEISIVNPKTKAEMIEYALSDNDRAGEYEEEKLAELVYPYLEEIQLEDYKIDIGEPVNLKQIIENYTPDVDGEDEININKNLKNIKILNLYAGIGGNRKLWGDLNITSVEINSEIAQIYKDYFPNDELIIDDAHKYLEKHFNEYDFIWSSPPCPTHSRMRKNFGNQKPIYPDMRLYEEILFLDGYFEGKWVIENVISWYDPLIKPQERGRHYYWSNFIISENDIFKIIEIGSIDRFDNSIEKRFGFDLSKYKISSNYPKDKIIRNMVHPKVGKYILNCAYNKSD